MNGNGERWAKVSRYAANFLRRFDDAHTRAEREDIAQEAVYMAWRWQHLPRHGAGLRASVQTITRRHRLRAVRNCERDGWLTYTDFGVGSVAEPAAPTEPSTDLVVAGRAVPMQWARSRLSGALECLTALDRNLLLGFHEGFCCAELAQRYGRTRECVKSRIHRARRRLQKEFEGLVRAAGDPEREGEVDE